MNSPISCYLSLAIMLSGCATIFDRYAEPLSGPTAKVRFVASSPIFGNVPVYQILSDSVCGTYSPATNANMRFIGILHGLTLERKSIGMPLAEGILEKDFTEISIPAGTPFQFDIGLFRTGFGGIDTATRTYTVTWNRCNVTSEFVPEMGQFYEVVYSTLSDGSCSASVMKFARTDKGSYSRIPEDTARKRSTQCKW